jgi:osomolarity two-component system sensor histidine kinase NIK1
MSAAVSFPNAANKSSVSDLMNNLDIGSSSMGSMSRTTSTPLPDLNSLPSDFIDHLVLITQAIANSKQSASPTTHTTSESNGNEHGNQISLPLPRFQTSTEDARMQQIQANIDTLVHRLWKAEDQLESRSHNGIQEGEKKAFPYPLSQEHPQSSSYPLSYPLGFDETGPVLLRPTEQQGGGESAEGAVGAFERYSDESGLSAQEELRLLKAQVQDIARVCKVREIAFESMRSCC